jgi:F-type H+-transporting ATPase subunit epsilon
MNTYHLTIVTPQSVFFSGEVVSLIVPGGAGSFGVLAYHAPIISTLLTGPLTLITSNAERQVYNIGPGFLDVVNNRATVITASIEALPDPNEKG